MVKPVVAGLVVLATAILGAASSLAASGPWLDHEQARVRLIAAQSAVGDGEQLSLGLEFRLAPGWKIYWRSPGDAGYPPDIDWSRSSNLERAELSWPVPERFSLFGLETFGYGEQIVLPLSVEPRTAAASLRLVGDLTYLVCAEVCIPHEGVLRLDLPAGPAAHSREALLIESFAARVPGDGSAAGLSLERAVLAGPADDQVLLVDLHAERPLEAPDVIVEGPSGFAFGKPAVSLSRERLTAEMRVPVSRGQQASGVLEGKRVTLTVFDGARGLERTAVLRYADPAAALDAALASPGPSLLWMLALALLGGLILNLMPCVLPVLSIKLLSVIDQGGRARGAIRAGFLASAAGIVATFLLLAAVAIAVKAAGMTVGWGIQFQQPVFLSAMALLVVLFACNLFGFFEIPLPGWLGGLASAPAPERLASQGARPALAGHFLTGALATLLATPCSAPFLGTAVGFALARGPLEILAIFAALGLGLALPYLGVAAVPRLAGALPRPGRWMMTLRRLLGLALAGTGVWLLWVLSRQAGDELAVALGALLATITVLLGLSARRRRPAGDAGWQRAARGATAGLAALAVALPLVVGGPTAGGSADDGLWRAFDRAAIEDHVAAGRLVFVDVTADWCITCQVNKRLVLEDPRVADRLAAESLRPMRADWTLPDERISDFLARFGRYGIPFNVVFGPGAPEGIPLPELLTVSGVLGALDQAAGAPAPDGAAVAGRDASAAPRLE